MKTDILVWAGLFVVALFAFATGYTVTSEVPVETQTEDQSETAIALDPLNNQNLMAVRNDFRTDWSIWSVPGYGFSTDGGYTWQTDLFLPPGYVYGFDPSCAWDRYENAFYCYSASQFLYTPGPLHVSRTTNFGHS